MPINFIKKLRNNLRVAELDYTKQLISGFKSKYEKRIFDCSDGEYLIVTEVTQLDTDIAGYLAKYPDGNPLEDEDIGFYYDCVIINLSPGKYEKTKYKKYHSDDLSDFKNEISFADLEKIVLGHIKKDIADIIL